MRYYLVFFAVVLTSLLVGQDSKATTSKIIYKWQGAEPEAQLNQGSMPADPQMSVLLQSNLRNAVALLATIEGELVFNRKMARYRTLPKPDEEGIGHIIVKALAKSNFIYYSSIDGQVKIQEPTVAGPQYLIDIPVHYYTWEVTDERKDIGKYSCRKAIGSRADLPPVEAWYTMEIPVPFGPVHVDGLPGLVMEVNFQSTRVYASEIYLSDKSAKGQVLQMPTKGKRITLQ